ncbi:hypothetical protein PHET_01919 [Paragonimus heterotremus]|uniref:Uncharacterized protein n=1 Tax=Paragonimus heterotremus TaxID=100268 RepID=A0A8J4X2F9_9TREM|nr:hypothetical protein PHET_01919 [Paragonimus heterotremus]
MHNSVEIKHGALKLQIILHKSQEIEYWIEKVDQNPVNFIPPPKELRSAIGAELDETTIAGERWTVKV